MDAPPDGWRAPGRAEVRRGAPRRSCSSSPSGFVLRFRRLDLPDRCRRADRDREGVHGPQPVNGDRHGEPLADRRPGRPTGQSATSASSCCSRIDGFPDPAAGPARPRSTVSQYSPTHSPTGAGVRRRRHQRPVAVRDLREQLAHDLVPGQGSPARPSDAWAAAGHHHPGSTPAALPAPPSGARATVRGGTPARRALFCVDQRARVVDGDSPKARRYSTEKRPEWRKPWDDATSETFRSRGSAARSAARTAASLRSRR